MSPSPTESAPAGAGERDELHRRVLALIDRLGGSEDRPGAGRDDRARDALLLDVARWQARRVEPYRRLLAARGIDPERARSPAELPALPTDVFRHVRVAAHPPAADLRVFRTSGTTRPPRGEHPLRDLALYDRAARAAARAALFPDADAERLRLVSLVPGPDEAPDSSLAYMLGRFAEWFGAGESVVAWRAGGLDADVLAAALDDAAASGAAVALLGTSFAFVHAEEALAARRWRLPAGSRVMQTGGFKGRSREVAPEAMLHRLAARYGVPEDHVVAEYGMTELSSQLYETPLAAARGDAAAAGERRLRPPPWVRLTLVDPETLRPAPPGVPGLVRIDDPANLDTAWAVQTSDLARPAAPDGIVLLGRAPGADLRGCSLAVEEALWA